MTMTVQQLRDLGYEVVKASPCEVGLVFRDKGIRTWFCQDFDHRLPGLDHPIIAETIRLHGIFHGWFDKPSA